MRKGVYFALFAMIIIVSAANYLVQFPINDWLTWGVFPYPVSFLVTELTNRFYGPRTARRVVYVGFVVAVFCSALLSTPKIAFASGSAFLVSQLLDIAIFNRFRQGVWWYGPLFASISASIVDASVFWTLAFWGENISVLTLAIGDTAIKMSMDLAMLSPFRFFIRSQSQMYFRPN
ncbi:MAG: queuosine precursor transporter [Chlamydiales bacterium]